MSFQAVQIRGRVTKGLAPFYGLSSSTQIDQALVLGLSGRGAVGKLDCSFTLDAPTGSGKYMYFAYPKVYGLADFLDTDSQFYGGWDGAHNDSINFYGPVVIPIEYRGKVQDFYVYRTDYPELGVCNWTVSQQA